MNKNNLSELNLLLDFLKTRLLFPYKSVAFRLYFITIIITVGLLSSTFGLFSTVDMTKELDSRNISISLLGYSLVLLCSSAIEFIFIHFKNDEQKYSSLRDPIIMIGVSSIIFGIVISIFTFYIDIGWMQLIISSLMTLFVWIFWWISNARTLSVINNFPPKMIDITGGDTDIQGTITSEYTT